MKTLKQLLQKRLAIFLITLSATPIFGQQLTETKGIKFYEHHSSDMTDEPLGNSANGSQSGYDFVNRTYYSSFDDATFGKYANGEEANIDMVEHNGPFGTMGASMNLGFTSGVSTIWNGEIQGNGTTKWMKAPQGFNYESASSLNDLKNAYDSSKASQAVYAVNDGDIYIGRIRNSETYVAIKCYNIVIASSAPDGVTKGNVAFSFDYKISGNTSGVSTINGTSIKIFPQPAFNEISITTNNNTSIQTVDIYNMLGEKMVISRTDLTNKKLNIEHLNAGVYLVQITASTGEILTHKIIKN